MRLLSLLRALLPHTPSPATLPPRHQEPTMSASASEDVSMLDKVALEFGGDISASQEEILATSAFLSGDNALPASPDEEILATSAFLRGDNALPASRDEEEDVESVSAKVALECGGEDISASQEELLATSAFLGGDNGLPASLDEEVLATTSDATQQQHGDPVTMCTLPFTPTPSESPAPLSDPRRKPRVCTRKVRGARFRTPTPSPEKQQQPETEAEQPIHVDPLIRAVLMIPTKTTTAATTTSNPEQVFLALARRKGLI